MKPLGKSPFAQRLLVVLGLVLAFLSSQVMAQNADVYAALDALNKSLGLPVTNSHGVITKPALTLGTISSANLSEIVTTIGVTSGTYQVSGTNEIAGLTPTLTGGTTVIFGASADSRLAVDGSNILTLLESGTPSLKPSAAALDFLGDAYSALAASTTASTSPFWGDVAEQTVRNSVYTTGPDALMGTAIDSAQEKVVDAAVAELNVNYDDVVTKALLVSDPNALEQALLVYNAIHTAAPPSLPALATAIDTTDLAAIDAATNAGGNPGVFLYNFFLKGNSTADQQGFAQGFTAGETPSQLETTATETVNNATNSLNTASRTNIALGLILSGSTTTTGTGLTTIVGDVTTGIVSGYVTNFGGSGATAQAADADQAKLASSLLSSLGLSYATTIAGSGALDLNDVADDVAAYAVVVAKTSFIADDTTGANEATVASGVGNNYVLAGTGDGSALTSPDATALGLKIAVTQGVVGAFQKYATPIVEAVIGQILATPNLTAADFNTILTSYITGISTTGSYLGGDVLKANDGLRGTLLAAVVAAVSNSGTSATLDIPSIAAAASLTDNATSTTGPAKAKNVTAIIFPTLVELTSSDSVVKAIAAAVAETGTDAGSLAVPDQYAAALIAAAKTTVSLVQDVAIGTAEDHNITSSASYGGADTYIKTLASDVDGSVPDITEISDALAGAPGFTPEQIGIDVTDGAGNRAINIADALASAYGNSTAGTIAEITAAVTSSTSASVNDSARLKIAEGAAGATGSNNVVAVAVSGSVGVTISSNADRAAFAKGFAGVYTAVAPGIADAVADSIPSPGTDATLVTDLDLIATDVAGQVKPSAVTTATSVEEIALTNAVDPILTATTFATSFASTVGAVPAVAYTAAYNRTLAESGTIGVSVDELHAIVSSASTAGLVAQQVAEAAALGTDPTSRVGSDTFNYSYYTIAGIFGTTISAGTGPLVKDFAAIAGDLAAPLEVAGAPSGPVYNNAAAAIAYDLIITLASPVYNSTNLGYIESIAKAVAAAQPDAAADIFGYAAEAVNQLARGVGGSGWTTTHGGVTSYTILDTFLATLESDIQAAAVAADSTNSGAIMSALQGVWNPMTSGSLNILSEFAGGDGTSATVDETPVVNF